MTTGIDHIVAQNVAAIGMAGLFLWYVNKRDGLMQATFDKFSEKLEKLTAAITSLEHRLGNVEEEERKRRTR